MTVNLSIKECPTPLADRLRLRAERNHRSLQGELMAIIERAANESPDRSSPTRPRPAIASGSIVAGRPSSTSAAERPRGRLAAGRRPAGRAAGGRHHPR